MPGKVDDLKPWNPNKVAAMGENTNIMLDLDFLEPLARMRPERYHQIAVAFNVANNAIRNMMKTAPNVLGGAETED